MQIHFHSLLCVMMSQQSGDQFAALIRVNTVVQAVVGNVTGRYQSKTRETVQSQNSKFKQRKMRTLRNVSRGNTRLRDECVCECGLRSLIDEHQVN